MAGIIAQLTRSARERSNKARRDLLRGFLLKWGHSLFILTSQNHVETFLFEVEILLLLYCQLATLPTVDLKERHTGPEEGAR